MKMSSLSNLKRTAAPLIHRLPPEILLEVVSILLDKNSRNMIFPSHVCRLWRRLIIQSALLWTCIVLGDRNEYGVSSYLLAVFERAREHPMSLSITPDNDQRDPYGLLEDVILMSPIECKWRSISYTSDKIEDFTFFFKDDIDVSHLEVFSFTCRKRGYGSIEWDLPEGVVDFRPFTKLRSLTLDFTQRLVPAKVFAPWDQLTDLTITSRIYADQYLIILRQCVNLEKCCLRPAIRSEDDSDIESDEDEEKDNQEPLLFRKLRRLEVATDAPLTLIPSLLECPALEEAIIHYEVEEEEGECNELMSLLRRCGKTLRKVQLPGLACYDFKYIQQELSTLEDLTISGSMGWPSFDKHNEDSDHERNAYKDGTRSFLEPLIAHPEYLPQLKTLRIINQRIEERVLLERLLSRFVEARLSTKNGGSELQEVVFGLDKVASQEQRARRKKWSQWRNNGVRMKFN
ncbi:unnamed protein product [Cyclocybe aegerita]|uniref:F-box domain-containing protein n=1 Tax=Cyclocybe aegerita TaxID=1973307 RepID=A0A8S0W084_CYCAE|nr:unnamed protein product [Cyclocybe aegerita]